MEFATCPVDDVHQGRSDCGVMDGVGLGEGITVGSDLAVRLLAWLGHRLNDDVPMP